MTLPDPAPEAPKKSSRRSDRFVAHVHELCASKGSRADLRRGLGLPVERCNYLHRYLVPFLSEGVHPDARRAHYAVASLIAAQPRAARDARAMRPVAADDVAYWSRRANLGAALGQAVSKRVIKPRTAESTLHLMSRQSTEAIHPRLPALTRQLLGNGVAVDWAVLLEDLSWWNRSREHIATRWFESYFRITSAAPAGDDDALPETPDLNEENNA
ncbi:type I-E CRISPR-associated protein Cse2/CasB [Streptomyces sp. NPDC058202]|uniref:type I-E CRISPR-associated protein Cse2/CasB n=1 Tax=Streptomyces sp. NPDC058202 TaxID=3346380 RepID=UPI0036E7FC4A